MTNADRYKIYIDAPVNGNINRPSGPIFFDDHLATSLGKDPDGSRLQKIADLILSANYYPKDVIEFYIEGDQLEIGKRVLQIAPLTPWGFPKVYSMVEISHLEITDNSITVGYYTTENHMAKGWWKAEFSLQKGEIFLTVASLAMPGSIWYWLGLPIARSLQLRARQRAIERFQSI
jgi:hypothetical protein